MVPSLSASHGYVRERRGKRLRKIEIQEDVRPGAEPGVQPGPGVGPLAVGAGRGTWTGLAAASSTDRPAKKRSLTTSAASGSSPASRVSGLVEVQEVVRVGLARAARPGRGRSACAAPPRFSVFLRRAFSTRMRRMASAAAAKKCPRPFQCAAVLAAHQPQVGLVDQGGRPAASGRASPGPASGPPACAARRRPAAGAARPPSGRPARCPGGCGSRPSSTGSPFPEIGLRSIHLAGMAFPPDPGGWVRLDHRLTASHSRR